MSNWITESPEQTRWAERIMAHIAVDGRGCWVWTLGLDRHGYGRFRAVIDGRRRQFSTHRASWLAFRGPIPYPLMPDHLCRNRACCNPDHMEIVTNSVNTLRGDHSNKAGRSGRRPYGPVGCNAHGFIDGYGHRMANGRMRWVCRPCAAERRLRFNAAHA